MEVLNKEQFMALVYKRFERKEKERIAREKRKENDYRSYKVEKVMDHNIIYTNNKKIRR